MPENTDARFSRTELLIGEEGVRRLAAAHITLFGLGGVGAYAAEAVARAGVGRITLVDCDVVEPSNLNRQLVALESTLGRAKVEVAKERIRDIHPQAIVSAIRTYAGPDNLDALLEGAEFVIDAIDAVDAKVHLLSACHRRRIPVVSCMGAARKLRPTGVRVADLRQTRQCPLARTVRQRLRKEGILEGILCVFTEEPARPNLHTPASPDSRDEFQELPQKTLPQGSISYVPGIVGLTAAGVAISALLGVDVPSRPA